jgi:hypothetical protein
VIGARSTSTLAHSPPNPTRWRRYAQVTTSAVRGVDGSESVLERQTEPDPYPNPNPNCSWGVRRRLVLNTAPPPPGGSRPTSRSTRAIASGSVATSSGVGRSSVVAERAPQASAALAGLPTARNASRPPRRGTAPLARGPLALPRAR